MFQKATYLMVKKIADRAVCLMDIPDDWGKQYNVKLYEDTYDAAISFAKKFPDTMWCWGNHDLSYQWYQLETGYSPMAEYTVNRKLTDLKVALPEDNPIRYVGRIDNVLFSHGGLSETFVEQYVSASKYNDVDYVLDTINRLGKNDMWDDGSPIWLRPQYEKVKMYKPRTLLQVVGHTPIKLCDNLPEDITYFHAQWRRQRLTEKGKDYVIVDQIKGKGHYVGTYLALTTLERYWWGEGEVKFYMDGDVDYPTICGTGTEDYFGGSWIFAHQVNGRTVEQNYSTPYLGYLYYSSHDELVHNQYHNDDCPPMRGFYRWHIQDPICFEEDLKVTIQQIGVGYRGLFERQDDMAVLLTGIRQNLIHHLYH